MEKIKVESSCIDSIGWEDGELYVDFKSGHSYKYLNVVRQTFLEMIGSKSRGQYFRKNILNKYNFVKIS